MSPVAARMSRGSAVVRIPARPFIRLAHPGEQQRNHAFGIVFKGCWGDFQDASTVTLNRISGFGRAQEMRIATTADLTAYV